MTDTPVATAPERTEVATRPPYRLRLAPDVAGRLGRYISPVVATVRTAFEERRREGDTGGADRLTIDLSDATTVPGAQLILLTNLLRQTLGDGVEITLTGARPALMGALVTFDLPRDVVLIDARGRRWTG
jgi:hypothetical protein